MAYFHELKINSIQNYNSSIGNTFLEYVSSTKMFNDVNQKGEERTIQLPEEESGIRSLSKVKRIADAYNAMLQDRFSSSASNLISRSHIFYDAKQMPRKSNRSRSRAYRQSPHDKRWLTWDATHSTQRWSSDPNIGVATANTKLGNFNSVKKIVSAEEELANTAPDEGVCDISSTSNWLGVNHLHSAGRHSITSSLGSSALSEDDFALSRSSSCTFLPGRESRSVSTDSAVEVDLIPLRLGDRKESPSRSISYDQYEQKSNLKIKTGRSDSCDLPSRPIIQPPSVVISDHSGDIVSFKVALLNDDFNMSNHLHLPSMSSYVSEPLNEFGLSVSKICPRKVSDCSTCSSVSTVDMSPDSHLSLDDLLYSRRTSCCSNCSAYTTADIIEEVEYPSSVMTPEDIAEGIEGMVAKEQAEEEERQLMMEAMTQDKQDISSEKTSNWRKVKNVVQWTPFIQTYRKKKYPWVQLAGHQGNFKAGEKQGTILKKFCAAEQVALETLMSDTLKPYVPEYMGLVDSSDNEQYLQLQDLLSDFNAPCVMDIKMGVRTYLEDELAKAREKPKLRKDMYEKMIQIDSNAPSEAEHRAQAVTKPRYMVWRETISSTATLGFRIEGVKKSDGTSSKDFKTTRSQEQVLGSLGGFVDGYGHAPGKYLTRLKAIRDTLLSSKFFMSHELIGSSLLFVHNEDNAVVWLIDFAKSIPLPEDVKVTHRSPWVEGTHEDGYLLGLDNLISIMTQLDQKHNDSKENNPNLLGEKSTPQESLKLSNDDKMTATDNKSTTPSINSSNNAPSTTNNTIPINNLILSTSSNLENKTTESSQGNSTSTNPDSSSYESKRNSIKNSTETKS